MFQYSKLNRGKKCSVNSKTAKTARSMADETGASLLPAVWFNTQNNQGTECHIYRRNFHTNR